ncbi:MAG: hypothetical protein ABI650_08220 [Dokdonella sp.]
MRPAITIAACCMSKIAGMRNFSSDSRQRNAMTDYAEATINEVINRMGSSQAQVTGDALHVVNLAGAHEQAVGLGIIVNFRERR